MLRRLRSVGGLVVIALLALFTFVPLAGAAPRAAETKNITIKDFAFDPKTITINVGDTITWTNEGPSPHTVTADEAGGFDAGNLDKGATNPSVIEKLRKLPGIDVRMHNSLHAKVYYTDKGCIVGSANASANGLALEGTELTQWREANCLVDDPNLLHEIHVWFLELWKNEAKAIHEKDLERARLVWERQRKRRPMGLQRANSRTSLLEFARDHPEDRPHGRADPERLRSRPHRRRHRRPLHSLLRRRSHGRALPDPLLRTDRPAG